MDDLHRRVLSVLGIPEDNLVSFGGQHQPLLIRIRGVARDLFELRRDDCIRGLGILLIMKDFVRVLLQILDGVGNLLLVYINERVFIIAIDVHHQRMTADLGEVAGLIVCIQRRSRLCVKGLGGTCQCAALGLFRDIRKSFIRVFDSVLDGVFHQIVGRPLGVEVQILGNGHGEVECLLNAVLLIEPADEGVIAVGRIIRLLNGSTVGHVFPSFQRSAVRYDFFLEERPDGMGLGNPLGVENHVGSRHGHGAQVSLRANIATRSRIPTRKLISVRFQLIRIIRCEVVSVQRRFILDAAALTRYFRIIVVELQVVAVARIIEVIVLLLASLSVAIEYRIGLPLSKSRNRVEFFFISQS